MPTTTAPDHEVATAMRAYRQAERTLDRRREALSDAIARAIHERGHRQADIARQTGYTREHIRRICRSYVEREIGRSSSPF